MDSSPAPTRRRSRRPDSLSQAAPFALTETGSSHARSLVVWDVPSAIACRSPFSIKVGVKCDGNCDARGWKLEVRDERGELRSVTIAGAATWSGTEGLYGAEIELVAPDSEGLFGWKVVAPASESPAPEESEAHVGHQESAAGFNVRTVAEAECRLTVIAVGRDSLQPVNGARVVVHPYRAATDDRGIAELDLPLGRYRLFVTGRGFLPQRLDGELTEAATVRVELEPDLGPSDAELWA